MTEPAPPRGGAAPAPTPLRDGAREAGLSLLAPGRRWPHYVLEHVFDWTSRSLRRFLGERGWGLRELRTGFRKTFTAAYLGAYAGCVGSWLPPGIGLLGNRAFTVPTGEMLVIAAAPPEGGSAPAAAAAAGSPG